MSKIKTPRVARGHRSIKRIPKSMRQVTGKELPVRTISHTWHAHKIKGARDIARIGFAEWEPVVADALRELEQSRYFKANREAHVIARVHTLLDTVRRRGEQLQELIQELEAFSYSVSHDLRAPLRAMGGYARVLLEEQAHTLDDEGRRMLDRIYKSSLFMGALIDDLLEFSRMGRREIQESDINIEEMFQNGFLDLYAEEKKRKVDFKIAPGMPNARGDRAMLKQVVVNLLSNALKFSRHRDVASIEVGGKPEGREILYYVKDNGAGFDMQYASKMFGVFQRLHTQEEFEGTGVGLALVKRIVERHGGKVWAQGKPNEGATFFFSLPA